MKEPKVGPRRGRPPGIRVNGEQLKQLRAEYTVEDPLGGRRTTCSQSDFAGKLDVALSTYQKAERSGRIAENELRHMVKRINELLAQGDHSTSTPRRVTFENLALPE
jgi:hypothetical protein